MRKGIPSIMSQCNCGHRIHIRRSSTYHEAPLTSPARSPFFVFSPQTSFLRWGLAGGWWLLSFFALIGCRTADDYQDNPSYYAAPTAQTSPYAQVYTSQNAAHLYVPQPATTGNNTSTVTGVVNANGTSNGTTVAYTCTPTAVMMTDGRGHYATGYVQMCQPVTMQNGVVVPANTATSTVLPTTTNTAYNPAQMPIQPLSGYPGYGTIQTPGGVAVIAIPGGTTSNGTAVAGTTTTVGTAPPFGANAYSGNAYGTSVSTGEALIPPIPSGTASTAPVPTNAAASGTENTLQPMSPPPSFAAISSESPLVSNSTPATQNDPNTEPVNKHPSTYANTASVGSEVPAFQF